MIIKDLQKFDTLLAFITATTLYYIKNRNLTESIKFSFTFVIIFLLLLNIFTKFF